MIGLIYIILHTHKYDHGRPSFGLDIINQKNLLLEMNEFISKMTVHRKKKEHYFRFKKVDKFRNNNINTILYLILFFRNFNNK